MTMEKIKALVEHALKHAVDSLNDDGNLMMMFHLVQRSGGNTLIGIDGAITNSEAEKRKLATLIRAKMAELGDVEAVMMVSDIWFANMTREQEAMKKTLGLTVEQAAAAGICPKQEAISVLIDTADFQQMTVQPYRRGKGGRAVTLEGAPIVTASTQDANGVSGKFGGHFANFFDHGEEARR